MPSDDSDEDKIMSSSDSDEEDGTSASESESSVEEVERDPLRLNPPTSKQLWQSIDETSTGDDPVIVSIRLPMHVPLSDLNGIELELVDDDNEHPTSAFNAIAGKFVSSTVDDYGEHPEYSLISTPAEDLASLRILQPKGGDKEGREASSQPKKKGNKGRGRNKSGEKKNDDSFLMPSNLRVTHYFSTVYSSVTPDRMPTEIELAPGRHTAPTPKGDLVKEITTAYEPIPQKANLKRRWMPMLGERCYRTAVEGALETTGTIVKEASCHRSLTQILMDRGARLHKKQKKGGEEARAKEAVDTDEDSPKLSLKGQSKSKENLSANKEAQSAGASSPSKSSSRKSKSAKKMSKKNRK